MGRLERKLDAGLIRRVLAGIKPPPEPLKHKKKPRPTNSYRAARHNAVRRRRLGALVLQRQRRLAA